MKLSDFKVGDLYFSEDYDDKPGVVTEVVTDDDYQPIRVEWPDGSYTWPEAKYKFKKVKKNV